MSDWARIYGSSFTDQTFLPQHFSPIPDNRTADSIITTTTTTASETDTKFQSGPQFMTDKTIQVANKPSYLQVAADGRVGKSSPRRRSRASRRAPTTTLSTDTKNFRAMVQQFTGGPSAPFFQGLAHGVTFGGGIVGSGQQLTRFAPVQAAPEEELGIGSGGMRFMNMYTDNERANIVDHMMIGGGFGGGGYNGGSSNMQMQITPTNSMINGRFNGFMSS